MNLYRSLTLATLAAGLLVAAAGLADDCPRAAPDEVRFTSGSGNVDFPHALHAEMDIPCEDCHHETRAGTLTMPHPQYFEDFWIRCETCHRAASEPSCAQTCSQCHHGSPVTIADETQSSKVVIHKTCWKCHDAGTGAEASNSCSFCHKRETRSQHE